MTHFASSRKIHSKGRDTDELILTCKDINACILTIFIHAKESILKDFFFDLNRNPSFFNRWMFFGITQGIKHFSVFEFV